MSVYHVLYAADERFAGILAVALESLLVHHRHIDQLRVHILSNGLSEASQQKLQALARRHHRTFHIMSMPELERFTGIPVACQSKITATAYYRLFIADMLPEVDRVLYLDCDTFVCEPLDALFYKPLENSCAAVSEPWSPHLKKRLGLSRPDENYNSGVLLIDLAAWRRENLQEAFQGYIQRQDGKVYFEDQGVLNMVLKGKIDKMPLRYNVTTPYYAYGPKGTSIACGCMIPYSEAEVREAINRPAVVHFTNCYVAARPWVEGSRHPYAGEWLKLKANTPWEDAPLWPDQKDRAREMCSHIYHLLPGNLKHRFTYLVNGVIRPMLE